jgi:hypothetical protein
VLTPKGIALSRLEEAVVLEKARACSAISAIASTLRAPQEQPEPEAQ